MQSRDCDFWRILTATFNILQSHFELWLQFSTFCSHISNYDCNFQHFAVTFRIMTAKCWKLQSRDCRFQNLQSNFELWLQLSTFYSHNSNYDCNFQHFAVTFRIMTAKCWKLQSRDCRFQFAVIIRNVTVTFEGVYNFRSLYFVSVKIIRFPIFLENNWLSLRDIFLRRGYLAGGRSNRTGGYLTGGRSNSLS